MNKRTRKHSFSQRESNKRAGKVHAKKHFGQHFLNDENIARKIVDTLSLQGYRHILEIGPGMGMLTKYLLKTPIELYTIEIDSASVAYLQQHYPQFAGNIINGDFLDYNIEQVFGDKPFAVTGNFPYHISSQILFKVLGMRARVPEFSGMFQKEMAQRICEKEGSKIYGILSVLTQAFYDAEYLFTVPGHVFTPPPKVKSGVIRLKRKTNYKLPCNEQLFFNVVKTAFNQRRKMLRNSLKTLNLPHNLKEDTIFGRRPEQLSVPDFIELTLKIERYVL